MVETNIEKRFESGFQVLGAPSCEELETIALAHCKNLDAVPRCEAYNLQRKVSLAGRRSIARSSFFVRAHSGYARVRNSVFVSPTEGVHITKIDYPKSSDFPWKVVEAYKKDYGKEPEKNSLGTDEFKIIV